MYMVNSLSFLSNGSLNFIGFLDDNQAAWVHSDRGDLLLYTGLNDKNGKEIYEGDKVRSLTEKQYIEYVVEYKDGAFYPICEQLSENFVIIGNIFEGING